MIAMLLLSACHSESALDEGGDSPGLQGENRYPFDGRGDDIPGMIITGLEELDASQTVSPWLVSIRRFHRASTTSAAGTISVELTRYADDFPVSAHIRFFSEALDTCLIRNGEGDEHPDPDNNPPPPVIDGGVTLVLNTASGLHGSIPRTRLSDGQFIYGLRGEPMANLPVGTTLSIPGAAFPTVAAYPIFEPAAPERLLPEASQSITAESDFSWLPLNQSDHMKIDFMAYDATGEFQAYPVSCWVQDDGAFELPGPVVEALEQTESVMGSAMSLRVRYSRVYSRVDVIDGIVFHQRTEVAENDEI